MRSRNAAMSAFLGPNQRTRNHLPVVRPAKSADWKTCPPEGGLGWVGPASCRQMMVGKPTWACSERRRPSSASPGPVGDRSPPPAWLGFPPAPSPTRRPGGRLSLRAPSRAIAVHSFFAKFSHFPGFGVERQSKRRTNRRASWDSDAFERVPFLSVSRLSQTQGGHWRGGWHLFSNSAPFPRRSGAAALARSAKPPALQGTGRPRRSPPAGSPDAGPLLPWPRKFPRHARRFVQLPSFPSCVRLATALYSSDSRYNVRFSWNS